MFRRTGSARRAGGRGSFAVWMLVTVGLLVPTQWFAYRQAMAGQGDQRFPISEWSDPRYFSTAAQARTVQPLRRSIVDEIAANAGDSGRSPRLTPTPRPSPSGGKSPSPTPTTSASSTPSPSPTPTPKPVPPPAIELRADHIESPDGSSDMFYRWRIQVENPSNGEWIDDLDVLTQVPIGMQRVQCGRGVGVAPGGDRAEPRAAAAPGVTCQAIGPAASEDGHDVAWHEPELGPGHVRIYTFEVRVTAGNGVVIRNHAHLKWARGTRTTNVCEFEIRKQSPQSCRASAE